MLDKLLAFVHISIGVFTAFYAFLVPAIFLLDFCYIIYTIIIFILWCIYDGCPITYYYYKYTKKIDYEALIKTESLLYIIGDNILDIVLLVSIYIASIRSKIMSIPITIGYLLMKLFYNCLIKKNTLFLTIKSYKLLKFLRPYIIKLILLLNILLIITIFYTNKKKLGF